MTIDSVVRELVRHDASASIVKEDVNPVGFARDLLGNLGDGSPIRQIEVEPGCSVRGILSELLRQCCIGAFRDLLVLADHEELLNAMLEERVRSAVSDALGSASDHGNLAREVGGLLEGEAAE